MHEREQEIELYFKTGGLGWLDAIEAMQALGYSAVDAEETVAQWDDEVRVDALPTR
jgi:hypothetical protein